jgi:hypothetical protein
VVVACSNVSWLTVVCFACCAVACPAARTRHLTPSLIHLLHARSLPTVLPVFPRLQGRHRIEYLDGEVAWHDMDEEQWRRLTPGEYQQALEKYQQSSGSSGGAGGSGSGRSRRSVGSGWETGGSGGIASSPMCGSPAAGAAAAAEAPAAGGDAASGPAAPSAAEAPAAAVTAPAPPGGDPFLFLSNTEVVPEATLADVLRPPLRCQQQQHQHQKQAACRPRLPPPKFNQNAQQQEEKEPGWLQAQPAGSSGPPHAAQPAPTASAGAAASAQQQLGRKRRAPAGSSSPPPASGRAAETSAGSGADYLPGPQQQTAMRMQLPPCTQDAAGALFEMMHQRQPAAAGGSSAPPLQPTSRHNTAAAGAAAGGFVSASQLLRDGHGEEQPGQQGEQGCGSAVPPSAPAGSKRSSKVLQDPGLFDGSHSEAPSAAAAAAAGRAARLSSDELPPDQLRLPDLFKGATPTQGGWSPAASSPLVDFDLTGSPAAGEGQGAAAPRPGPGSSGGGGGSGGGVRRIAAAIMTNDLQDKVLALAARVGGAQLENTVTE